MPTLRFPKGYSDFQQLRQAGLHYVDKSLMIDKVLQDPAQIILLPRPRRFGKTLNLSMLRYFFERTQEERRSLFAGLKIEQVQEAWVHFQRYPTIFITFKDAKFKTWSSLREHIAILLSEVYRTHDYVLAQAELNQEERLRFEALVAGEASDTVMAQSLRALCKHLYELHNQKVVLLIDEYDTPIHSAYEHKYYDEAISFFRGLLSAALKDNVYIFRGVMTGILRIAKESFFSGLNNIGVYSILRPEYAEYFGFTENEINALATQLEDPERIDALRRWYNGYWFGSRVIYNPWSVVEFLSSEDKVFRPYWINTSANSLINELVLEGKHDLRPEFEQLLHGEGLDKPIYENVVLPEMKNNSDMIWSLLFFSGYLKPIQFYTIQNREWAKLTIPNEEVRICFSDMTRSWFTSYAGGASSQVQRLLHTLLHGEERELHYLLQEMLKRSVSFHDTKERFFHGFVLGLLVNLADTYDVHSNRESGFGRCDILVIPKQPGKPGVALEFKVVDTEYNETIDQALDVAMKQLRDRDYASTLRERGANPIQLIAAAFLSKKVKLRIESETSATLVH